MTLMIAAAICTLMAVLILLRPLPALLLYGMTATYADGFGISQWLSDVWFFDQFMNIFFIVLLARAVFRLLGRSGHLNVIRSNVLVLLVVVAWCVFSIWVRGASLLGTASILPYLALPYVIIWVAFADASTSSRHLTGLVVVQSAIAVVVLIVPGLEFLQGNSYGAAAESLVPVGRASLYLPDASTLKGVAGNHYAQFHNPNVLGFYAVAAIAVGLYLISRPQLLVRLGGIVVMMAGVFMWLNSLTRGPMLGLLAMSAFSWLLLRDRRNQGEFSFWLPIKVLGILLIAVILQMRGALSFLIPSGDDISVTTRVQGYSEALQVIGQDLVFGRDVAYQWDPLARPHFIGLLFGAEYGVFAGVLITWMVFVTAGVIAIRLMMNKSIPTTDSLLAAMMFGAMAGIAATNNFAGPVLFGAILGHLMILGKVEQSLSVGHATRVPTKSTIPFILSPNGYSVSGPPIRRSSLPTRS